MQQCTVSSNLTLSAIEQSPDTSVSGLCSLFFPAKKLFNPLSLNFTQMIFYLLEYRSHSFHCHFWVPFWQRNGNETSSRAFSFSIARLTSTASGSRWENFLLTFVLSCGIFEPAEPPIISPIDLFVVAVEWGSAFFISKSVGAISTTSAEKKCPACSSYCLLNTVIGV